MEPVCERYAYLDLQVTTNHQSLAERKSTVEPLFFFEPSRPECSCPAMFLMGLCRNRTNYPLGFISNVT